MIGALLVTAMLGFHLKEQTARADWYAQPGLKVNSRKCEASLAKYEKMFGVQVPGFSYVRVRTLAQVAELTDVYAEGVVRSDRIIVSTKACSEHEMVHLVTQQIGQASAIFEEGTASKLAGDIHWLDFGIPQQEAKTYARDRGLSYGTIDGYTRNAQFHKEEIRVSWAPDGRMVYVNLEEINPWYSLANGWVSHLIKRHGMDALVAFYREQAKGRDAHVAFQTAYGADLDTTFNKWLRTGISITNPHLATGSSRK